LAEPGPERCPDCGGRLAAVSGAGTVYAYAVVHQVFRPDLAGDVPYVVALVDLSEGPRVVTRLVEFDPVRLRVGAPVRVVFRHVGSRVLPVFVPR
jgi:uncharacterized OB-fold protein